MRFLKAILGRLPRKDVGDGAGNVFFWRYTLFKCRWFAVYLHEFLRSDHDRCLHDHPWGFVSVILKAGYWEETTVPESDENYGLASSMRTWYRPGSILVRRATFAHRIEIKPDSRPWSLVFVGRKSRAWGFYTPKGWHEWTPGYSPICETAD